MWTDYELYIEDQLFHTTHRFDEAIEMAIETKKVNPDLRVVLYKITEEVVEFVE